jgi:hypothetical protein
MRSDFIYNQHIDGLTLTSLCVHLWKRAVAEHIEKILKGTFQNGPNGERVMGRHGSRYTLPPVDLTDRTLCASPASISMRCRGRRLPRQGSTLVPTPEINAPPSTVVA